MLGAEGLLALQKLGVDPAVALEAINGAQATVRHSFAEIISKQFIVTVVYL